MRWLFFILLSVGISGAQSLTTATSTIFSGSGNCQTCHAPGSPNTAALLDAHGNDVSPVTLWRSTMMANAARDPFWQAKVSAEVAANPHLEAVIEDKCTTCHSPMGRTQAIADGASGYTIAQMNADPLAMDGVSCTSCHQIKPDNLGQDASFSGHYIIENDRLIYGPFSNPNTSAMENNVNYTPVYGEHTKKSELCATCHTLFTPYVDNNGDITGEAPEQTPYLEWKNSKFASEGIECQTCHMPALKEGVVISNRPTSLSARSPYVNHYFVGGNTYMLGLLKKYGDELGVTATAAQFDSTIRRTMDMLQKETADLSSEFRWNGDTLEVRVAVINKTGHKFPTAYPSRRAWLNLSISEGNTIKWESGAYNRDSLEIEGLDEGYEPHHDVITAEDQIPVYQTIMEDVDGKVNYVLLRAAGFLKDNRIPPQGFTKQGPYYDSTRVEGLALEDPNFNSDANGIDTVTYRITGLSPGNDYQVRVRLYYQSLAPRYVKHLLSFDTDAVNRFRGYYEATPNLPVTVDSIAFTTNTTGLEDETALPRSPLLVEAWPNPFNPSVRLRVFSRESGPLNVDIYNNLGQLVYRVEKQGRGNSSTDFYWNGRNMSGASLPSGIYYAHVTLKGKKGSISQSLRLLLLK